VSAGSVDPCRGEREVQVSLRTVGSDDFDFGFEVTELAMRGYIEQTWGRWDDALHRRHHATTFKPDTHRVILVRGERAGILAVEQHVAHVQLEKLYLLPGARNRGVGSQVLRSVLKPAIASGRPVRLRVLAVNTPAQRFYVRHGFVVVAVTPERLFMESGGSSAGSTGTSADRQR
jgi:ribosomal protein S18 acetylase RimI-like enzyme